MPSPFPRAPGTRLPLCLGLLAIAWSVAALPAEPAPPLTLDAAIARALRGNPGLAGFDFALRAGEARVVQAGQLPAPSVALEVENVLGSCYFGGVDAAEITLALSQVVELGGRRDLRTGAARAGRAVVVAEQQAAQLDVLAEVTRRFVAAAAAAERVALAGEAAALARSTADEVARRVRAARSPEAELLRARAAVARASLAEERARMQQSAARQALAGTWGGDRPDFGVVQADLYRRPPLREFADLAARLDANPDFLRFASEARLRDAELRLLASRRRPDLELSAGVRRFQETRDQALVLGISVPLAGARRNAPALAEAAALRDGAAAGEAAARAAARTRLFGLYEELRQAGRESDELRDAVLPELQKALDATRYAYDRGRYGYVELADAQREFLEARAARIDAASLARDLLIDIERLTGEALVTTGSETP